MDDDKGLIVTADWRYAVAISGQFAGWVLYRGGEGQWATLRRATDEEMRDATRTAERR